MRAFMVIGLALSLSVACKSKPTEKPRTGPLYDRIGKIDGIKAVVDEFAGSVPGNEILGERFATIDMAGFRTQFANQLCRDVGGECPDGGQTLDDMYKSLALGEDEFLALVEAFVASMNSQGLPQTEQNDVIDTLMRMQERVVIAPAADPGPAAGPGGTDSP